MTLRDFLNKYKKVITRKEVASRLGITYARLNTLELGGGHKALTKYAPLIKEMIPGCTDDIYIPPKEDGSPRYTKVDKVYFTEDEREIIKQNAYKMNPRTLHKIFDGHLFSKYMHDKLLAIAKGDIKPATNIKLIEKYEN